MVLQSKAEGVKMQYATTIKTSKLSWRFKHKLIALSMAVLLTLTGTGLLAAPQASAATAPSFFECAVYEPFLGPSARNGCVAALQFWLQRIGGYSSISVDGIFGEETWMILVDWQKKNYLQHSGLMSSDDWRLMKSRCYESTSRRVICATHVTY
jgi:putative peptidoglycan binding protein